MGHQRRNFQGYTDDSAPILVGLGASSVSRSPQGYARNAAGTADHTQAIRAGRFSTHRGHVFAGQDLLRARIIGALMSDFRAERAELACFGTSMVEVDALLSQVALAFPGMVELDGTALAILDHAQPLTRVIARKFDALDQMKAQHSAVI